MKRPLGYIEYFMGNKKVIIRYILTLVITAIVLALTKVIITNTGEDLHNEDKKNEHYVSIYSNNKKTIEEETIKKLEELEDVKYLIPKNTFYIDFKGFVDSPGISINYMAKGDIEKYLDAVEINYHKEDVKSLEDGRTLVTNRLKKNQNFIKGDKIKISDSIELEYDGSFESKYLIGVTPKEFLYGSNEYFIIPKDGKIQSVKEKVVSIIKGKCRIDGTSNITKLSIEDSEGTFNAVKLIITLACAITTGVTTYLHYYNRRKEIGILKAIGYSDKNIIYRITKEIMISSLIALFISIGLINGIVYFMNTFLAEPKGYTYFTFNISMLSDMVIILVSIMLFSLIPTWVLLKGIDKIALIEGRE